MSLTRSFMVSDHGSFEMATWVDSRRSCTFCRVSVYTHLLGDTVISTAILHGLMHHSHVINIRGESYRLKDKRQACLLTSTPEEIQMEG